MMAVRHPTVVVTGASGAIGSATVEALKRRGVQVIALTRPSLDLSSMASVRTAARELNRTAGHIDALLNIAATFTTRYQKTKEGLETLRAANDLADLALSPAHAGTTGWLFKGARHIDAPRPTQDIGQQSTLWQKSTDLVELEGGF